MHRWCAVVSGGVTLKPPYHFAIEALLLGEKGSNEEIE